MLEGSLQQTRDGFWTMGWTFGPTNALPIEELGTECEIFASGAAAR